MAGAASQRAPALLRQDPPDPAGGRAEEPLSRPPSPSLDSKVRTYDQIKKNKAIDEETSAAIVSAVDAARPTLEITAMNYATFIAHLGDDDLGLDNRKGALTLFAWERALAQGIVDPVTLDDCSMKRSRPPSRSRPCAGRSGPRHRRRGRGRARWRRPTPLEADDEVAGRGLGARSQRAVEPHPGGGERRAMIRSRSPRTRKPPGRPSRRTPVYRWCTDPWLRSGWRTSCPSRCPACRKSSTHHDPSSPTNARTPLR